MSRAPCRMTQWSCVALVVLGLLPWALLVGSLLYRAVNSQLPITMSVIAWLVLLVPMWVAWFAISAWNQRHETAVPAMIMAAPVVLVTALFLALPAGAAEF